MPLPKVSSVSKFPLPHPIEWIVAALNNPNHYEKVGQFRYRGDAVRFQSGIKCWKTMLIAPAIGGVAR